MAAFRPIVPAQMEKTDGKAQAKGSLSMHSEDSNRRRATTACLACKRRKIKVGSKVQHISGEAESLTLFAVWW